MRLKILMLTAVAAAVTLSGCERHLKAPTDVGVCYFIGHPKGPDGKATVKFNPIARDQDTIEKCAVKLYAARRDMVATNTAGTVTEGAYQGSFLFVTGQTVDYGQTYEGPTFPLLVKDPYSDRLVTPGSVQVDDTPTDNGPHTVAIPKDLPKEGTGTAAPPAKPRSEVAAEVAG